METGQPTPECTHCKERAIQEEKQEELNFAILIALTPLLVMTFLGQAGLV